jgi:hypothetical protein
MGEMGEMGATGATGPIGPTGPTGPINQTPIGLKSGTLLDKVPKNMYIDKNTFVGSKSGPFTMGTVTHSSITHKTHGSVIPWANGTHNGCPTRSGPFNNCCWLKIEPIVKLPGEDPDEWDPNLAYLYPKTVYVPCFWHVEDEDEDEEQ